ncbi:hypothetical protein [Halomarina litorea]|uniref:hypothetical protein n=1 Tax=Halomarina litorea TaxID=2961595 RepID=UPI0020C36DB9|nr:hypothetical protein [Halomarina sp. BCD28]
MSTYEPFDPAVEVHGRTILAVANEALAQFAEEYRERALSTLAARGIENPDPEAWYPQTDWLAVFERLTETLEPHVLDRLGEQIPAVADWPDDAADSVEAGLRSIDEAYRRNHRGGDIGSYAFESTGERAGTVTARTPYPCVFDRGIVRAVARRSAPVDSFVLVEERGDGPCRRTGGDHCTYSVTW